MKIDKNKLVIALETVKPGLAQNEIIENTSSFLFSDGIVKTYNDEISISHPFPELKLKGLIRANEFYELLNKLKGNQIELFIKNNELSLKCGRVKASFVLNIEDSLPLDELEQTYDWHDLPDGFADKIELISKSCSRDMNTPVLTCIHINKKGFMESSDNYRVTRYYFESELETDTFLLPKQSALQAIKLAPIQYALAQGWVHFKNEEGTIISCRLFSDVFPDTSKFLDVKGRTLIFPKNFIHILEKAAIFKQGEDDMQVEAIISVKEGKMKVKSESFNQSKFEEYSSVKYEGEPFSFKVTPSLLYDILQRRKTCKIGTNMMQFKGKDWLFVNALRYNVTS